MILDWVPDCHHSVGHISQFESLKYRASLPAAFLFQIGPVVAYRTSLAPSEHTLDFRAAINNRPSHTDPISHFAEFTGTK